VSRTDNKLYRKEKDEKTENIINWHRAATSALKPIPLIVNPMLIRQKPAPIVHDQFNNCIQFAEQRDPEKVAN
jgi:hypothetical protein